jgi:hypothetical protein
MEREHQPGRRPSRSAAAKWRNIVTLAGLIVLGITPWAQAQLPPPAQPAFCPPLTSLATPTLFDVLFGTLPIRFPYQ